MKAVDRFLREFDLFFDVDLIPIDDRDQLLSEAAALADIVADWPEAGEIAEQLDMILASRASEDVLPFIRATNVDWLFDEKTKTLLFELLRVLRARLAFRLGEAAS